MTPILCLSPQPVCHNAPSGLPPYQPLPLNGIPAASQGHLRDISGTFIYSPEYVKTPFILLRHFTGFSKNRGEYAYTADKRWFVQGECSSITALFVFAVIDA